MKIIRDVREMRSYAEEQRAKGKIIALVPTLGALHEGHMSLLKRARKKADTIVLSLFLNPIQFSELSDFKNYPRTLRKDLRLAEAAHVNVVFSPKETEMYPKNFSTYVSEEVLSKELCGKSRPDHFRGVATVVAKLFNIIQPHVAFFGEKDAQQALIIEKMVKDLAWGIHIETVPTVRDMNGLALSSRNALLSSKEREDALSLNEALFMGKIMIAAGEKNPKTVIQKLRKIIQSRSSAKVDYIEILDAQTLKNFKTLPIRSAKKEKAKILIALAVKFGKVRLIDNIVV